MSDPYISEDTFVPVKLASGRHAIISAISLGGEEQVAARIPDFSGILDNVREMCTAVTEAIDKIPGKKISVEFGIAFGIESGQLVTLFAKASVEASLKISIELSN